METKLNVNFSSTRKTNKRRRYNGSDECEVMQVEDEVSLLPEISDFCEIVIDNVESLAVPMTSNPSSSRTASPLHKRLPCLLDGELFEVRFAETGDYIIVCKNCPGNKTIGGTLSSTGNYISHIKRLHPSLVQRMEEKRRIVHQTVKQTYRPSLVPRSNEGKVCVSGKEALDAISDYVINEMLPISTVEKPSFRNMISTIAQANPVPITVPDRTMFGISLEKRMQEMLCNVKKAFDKQQYICTTADIWIHGNQSFLGITGHFIDHDSFERKSFAVACNTTKFQHTYEKIAEAVHAVHEQFGIVGKVTHVVTNNATTFGKSFRHYMSAAEPGSDHSGDDDDEYHFDDIDVVELDLASDPMSDTDVYISLPPQLCCCSQSLSLVATKDADASAAAHLADAAGYRKIYRSSFAKLAAFWNVVSHSTSDDSEELRQKFTVPTPTHWLSYYDAIKTFLSEKTSLREPFAIPKLPDFKSIELEFLEEYVRVMQPLANGLTIIQGDEHCYMGIILPTLLSILKRIEKIDELKHCGPLRQMILTGLKRRFQKILNISSEESSEFVLASISHPRFKMTWVPEEHIDKTRSLFMAACELVQKSPAKSTGVSSASVDLDFFSVLDARNNCDEARSAVNTACLESLHYLEDNERSLSVLHKYPAVKAVFMKYNTSLPSSVPFERLFFSDGKLITPRSNKLSSKNFEMLALLRSNSSKVF